jgi:hypothetical protein
LPTKGTVSLIARQESQVSDKVFQGLAFYYFDYKNPTGNEAGAVFKSLIKQFALQNHDAFEDLEKFYTDRKADQADVSENPFASTPDTELLELLSKLLVRFKTTTIIVDALDEIEKSRANTVQLLWSIWSENGTTKMLFTSKDREGEDCAVLCRVPVP